MDSNGDPAGWRMRKPGRPVSGSARSRQRYPWLNNRGCMAEGTINPRTLKMHFEVYSCESDLI